MLLPDRRYKGFWHRILHDQTAEAIERDISQLAHFNVTTVPFHFHNRRAGQAGELPLALVGAGREAMASGRVDRTPVRPADV